MINNIDFEDKIGMMCTSFKPTFFDFILFYNSTMQSNLPSEVSLTGEEKDVIQNILIKHLTRTELEENVLDYRKQLGSDTSDDLVETLKEQLINKYSEKWWWPYGNNKRNNKRNYKSINELWWGWYTSSLINKEKIKDVYGDKDRFTEWVYSVDAYSEGDDDNKNLVALVYKTDNMSHLIDANDKVILSANWHIWGRPLIWKNGRTIGSIWHTSMQDKYYLLDQNNNKIWVWDQTISCYEDPKNEKIIVITFRDKGMTHVLYKGDTENFEEVFSTQSSVNFYTDNDDTLIFQFLKKLSKVPCFVDFRIITQLLWTRKKTSQALVDALQ